MRVLVLGSGAREHALAARLVAEGQAQHVICAPGNPGMAMLGPTANVDLTDPNTVAELARREQIDFTIVGPEVPLSLGVVDRFVGEGRLVIGPTRAAARLESSKAFAKDFMARHRVPTARFHTCQSATDALTVVRSGTYGFPVVLKADGLAAGKGVIIAEDRAAAEAAITALMNDRKFGAAGDCIVIEECLSGPEVSFFVLSDGERARAFGTAQDHKRLLDDDKGPNTGGMGAFAPSVVLDGALEAQITREIVEPVIAGMADEGHPFRGFLYVGLMLTVAGPKVIEFNVRLGDPEAQVILPLIDEPLLPLLVAGAEGHLPRTACRLGHDKLVAVTLASRGYPDSPDAGQPISGIADAEKVSQVFHAGTARRNGDLVTAGGRVLTVVGRGATFAEATARAYAGVDKIQFDGMQCRRDIARSAARIAK